jgi:hypothetical protein
MSLTAQELSDESAGVWGYHMVGRLKDGISLPQAAQDTDRVAQQIMRNFPPSMSAIHIKGDATLLREDAVDEIRSLLRTLFFAVAIVLLIACVNVAGLLLVRAIRRRREYAVRLALGARSGVIILESVCEGLLLSLSGGLLGLAFAATAIRFALHLLPESMPRVDSISMDASVVAFALSARAGHGSPVQSCACLRGVANQPYRKSQRGRPHRIGGIKPFLAAFQPCGRGDCHRSDAAHCIGRLSAQFPEDARRRSRLPPDHVLVAGYQSAPQAIFHEYLRSKPSTMPSSTGSRKARNRRRRHHQHPACIRCDFQELHTPSKDVPVESWKLKFAMFAITYGDYFRAMGIPLLDGRYLHDR